MLRKEFNLDPLSPVDVFPLINTMDGSTLVFYPMSDHISGMCIRIDSHDSLIAINSRLTYGRQRFTAAHELYHLYFQENFQLVVCPKNLDGNKHP